MTNREGKCPYKDNCEMYLPKSCCINRDDYLFCGLYLKRQRDRSARALESFASCSGDLQTLERLMGVNTHEVK